MSDAMCANCGALVTDGKWPECCELPDTEPARPAPVEVTTRCRHCGEGVFQVYVEALSETERPWMHLRDHYVYFHCDLSAEPEQP